MGKTVSVIIPIYNGDKYICDLLDSIKKQSWEGIQLVIGDDASHDDSVERVKSWISDNGDRFNDIEFIINKENLGLSANTSSLLKRASGEYVFIADQDDVWYPDKITKQVGYMEKNPKCMMCLCDRSISDDELNIMEESEYTYKCYKEKVLTFEKVIKYRMAYAANTMCIRNNCHELFEIPKGIVFHDTFLAIIASRYGTVDYIFEPMLIYRVHKKNLSGNYSPEFSRNFIECLVRYYRVSDRYLRSFQDGNIIREELRKRFGVELDNYEHGFVKPAYDSRFKTAWTLSRRAQNKKRIGIWNRF